MANKAFRKTQSNFNDYMSRIEELMKKSRGGGVYQGYDVNPYTELLPGRVINPTGLGDQQVTQDMSYTSNTPPNLGFTSYKSNLGGIAPYTESRDALPPPRDMTNTMLNFNSMYKEGYRFMPTSANDLLGQCAFFAEQITRMPDGSFWTIGNTVADKQAQLNGHIARGNGFLPGQRQAQMGNSIVFRGGKYGHVAVINRIEVQNGVPYYVLTESNLNGRQTVTHTRSIRADDPSIMGFLNTQPTKQFSEIPSFGAPPPVFGQNASGDYSTPSGTQESSVEQQQAETNPEQQAEQQAEQQRVEQELQQVIDRSKNAPLKAPTWSEQNLPQSITSNVQNIKQQVSPDLSRKTEKAGQKRGMQEYGVSEYLNKGDYSGALKAAAKIPGQEFKKRVMPPLSKFTEKTGDVLNIPERGISEDIARGDLSQVFRKGYEGIKDTFKPKEPEIRDEKYWETRGLLNPQNALRKAQSVEEAVGEAKTPNLQAPTSLEELFKKQKMIGDISGNQKYVEGVPKADRDIRDPFFKYGGGKSFDNYLQPNAETKYGGALRTGVFKDEFYQDPNAVGNVFGKTSEGGAATDKYKDYLRGNIQEGYDDPYTYETRGDYKYKIPVDQYWKNKHYMDLISKTPDVLKGTKDWSYSQYDRPTTQKLQNRGVKQAVQMDNPIMKSSVVNLFNKRGDENARLNKDVSGQLTSSLGEVYKPQQKGNILDSIKSVAIDYIPKLEKLFSKPEVTKKRIKKKKRSSSKSKSRTSNRPDTTDIRDLGGLNWRTDKPGVGVRFGSNNAPSVTELKNLPGLKWETKNRTPKKKSSWLANLFRKWF